MSRLRAPHAVLKTPRPCEATPYDTEWDLVCVSPGSKASIYCYLIGNLTPSHLTVKPWHLHRTHTSLARGEIHPTHTQWSQNSYRIYCNHTTFGLMYESSHYVVCVCVCAKDAVADVAHTDLHITCVCVCFRCCRWRCPHWSPYNVCVCVLDAVADVAHTDLHITYMCVCVF